MRPKSLGLHRKNGGPYLIYQHTSCPVPSLYLLCVEDLILADHVKKIIGHAHFGMLNLVSPTTKYDSQLLGFRMLEKTSKVTQWWSRTTGV